MFGSWASIGTEMLLALLYLWPGRTSLAARIAIGFHVALVWFGGGGLAWVYVQHALVQGAFFALPAPRGKSRVTASRLIRSALWLGVQYLAADIERRFERKFVPIFRATPTLDTEDRSARANERVGRIGQDVNGDGDELTIDVEIERLP
jgi:hypothetical protein